jgi:hypothetical protein
MVGRGHRRTLKTREFAPVNFSHQTGSQNTPTGNTIVIV